MELPDTLTVHVRQGQRSVAGAAVAVVVHTAKKNAFATLPRTTDSMGSVAFTGEEIAAAAEECKRLFPQDYGDLDKHATGHLSAELLGPKDIEWALKAHDLFADRFDYPEGYRRSLEQARDTLERLGETPVEASIEAPGTDAEIGVVNRIPWAPEPSREARLLDPDHPLSLLGKSAQH